MATKQGEVEAIPFNANEYVKVKLNPSGVKVLEAQHEELQKILHSSVREPFKLSLDENGYYKDQLWHLMQTFGPHLCMGVEPPFEMNFEFLQPSGIEVKDA